MNVSYTSARERLAEILEAAERDEVVTITRRGHPDCVLISASELRSMKEALHLLSSPSNRKRLEAALAESDAGRGTRLSGEELRNWKATLEANDEKGKTGRKRGR